MSKPNALRQVRQTEALLKLQDQHLSYDSSQQTYESLAGLSELSFLEFCKWLGVVLTPGQMAFSSVAYDGRWPTEPALHELAIIIFIRRCPDMYRRVVVGVIGGRGGKSYTLISIRVLWGAFVRDLSSLAPGQQAYAPIVAPKAELGEEVIRYIGGALKTRPDLEALIFVDNVEEIGIIRPDDGRLVVFKSFAATRGGTGVRGKSFTDGVMDECAFFRDAGFAVNDDEIYRAMAPRILPGGQLLLYSTPWGEEGLLYKMYDAGTSDFVLTARAKTLTMHDAPWLRDVIAEERRRDPENARREYDAEFMTSGTGQFFDSNAIKGATQTYDIEKYAYTPRYRYACAVDLGFKSDSSALVVVEYDGVYYRTVYVCELRPTPTAPLLPSEVMATFAGVAKWFGCSHLVSDGHYREAIAEHLQAFKLDLHDAPAGINGKIESHTRARAVLHEGRCILPEHPRLLSQLRGVVSKPTAGGGLSISSPRKPGGGHGDVASAWVLAVHHLATAIVEPAEELAPKYGSREYELWMWEKERPLMMESIERKYGRRDEDEW